jgi:hypothetical protein
LTIG